MGVCGSKDEDTTNQCAINSPSILLICDESDLLGSRRSDLHYSKCSLQIISPSYSYKRHFHNEENSLDYN